MTIKLRQTPDHKYVFETPLRGDELLRNPLLNKGSAFSHDERRRFGLEGLLPPGVASLEAQVRRAYRSVCRKNDPLEQYIGMRALQDRNETLFFRVLLEHLEELMPVVYTPTVGEGCRYYSRILRRPRGIWITPEHRGRVAQVLGNLDNPELIRLIVVTDNERILGLGDQGVGGMGIPVGKLALYTVAAGIHPTQTLPISLDVGTDNRELLEDDLYVGWPHPRLRGEPYAALVEEFVQAVKQCFPQALLQWEDFKKQNAFDLLDRYRDVLPSFNDDIQGTAAVALAAVVAASRIGGKSLAEQRVVVLGAGAAGIGIARQLRDALARAGLAGEALTEAICVLDSRGPVIADREFRDQYKREFAWPPELAARHGLRADSNLEDTVKRLRPSVLIGTSGTPGTFTESVVRAMAEHHERPAIFPLSNPTAKSEAVPADLLKWTDGRALIATGSPFDPVEIGGRSVRIGQCNNVYVFPGVGLGMLLSKAKRVSDSMFTVAAEAVATEALQHGSDLLFPPIRELRVVTSRVAEAVIREARDSGLGEPIEDAEVHERVAAAMWHPSYPALEASDA